MSDNKITAYLAEHPKMTGVLFTTMLLLSQAGGAMGNAMSNTAGP